jgi:glycosyltransferase involved in cell wall biosynthesis
MSTIPTTSVGDAPLGDRPTSSSRGPVDVCHLTVTDSLDSPRGLHKEATAAAEAGWLVTLIGVGGGCSYWRGVRRIGISEPSSRLRLQRAWQVFLRARALNPRLVHVHDLQTLLAGRLLKALSGCRLVYDAPEDYPLVYPKNLGLHGRQARLMSRVVDTFERAFTRKADAVITVDELIAERFVGWGRSTTVVRNLTPQEIATRGDLPPELVALTGRPIFVYLGEVGPKIAGLEILEACARVRESHPEAAALFVGGFSDENYASAFRTRVTRLDLTGSIVTLPAVPYRSVFAYLRHSTVGLVLYGRNNNYGDRCRWTHKLCDYLAAGLPMLASDFVGLRSVLEPLGIARFADPGKPLSVAKAMEQFLDAPAETAAMAERCRRAYELELNWESERRRLLGVYEGLLGDPPSGAVAAARRPTAYSPFDSHSDSIDRPVSR